jgi:replicative DNA helicase
LREFSVSNTVDRNIVLFSYLVDPRYPRIDRELLYNSMIESGLFSEYSQIFEVDNFLTPIYLQQHTKWSVPYEQIDLGKADVDAFYKRELEYRKKKALLHRLVQVSHDIEHVSLSELQEDISEINSAIKADKEIDIKIDARAAYDRAKNKVFGIQTGITQIDDVIHGIGYGTMTCIVGWTGHNKTTLALNTVYQALRSSFNVLYINLETNKELMYFQLLSRHSFEEAARLGGKPIEYLDMVKGLLSPEQEAFLFDVLIPDMEQLPGKIAFVEQSAFSDMSYPGMINLCASIPFQVDVVVVDYFQCLLPYIEGKNEFMLGNRLARDFTRLAVGDEVNGEKIVILLSQANKQGYQRAIENEGRYDEGAIADIPELKNAAYYIISVFRDDKLLQSNEVKVCLIKHRGGRILWEPIIVPVDNRFAALGSSVRDSGPVGVNEVGKVLNAGGFNLKTLLGV